MDILEAISYNLVKYIFYYYFYKLYYNKRNI
jgi:hypothetical protein